MNSTWSIRVYWILTCSIYPIAFDCLRVWCIYPIRWPLMLPVFILSVSSPAITIVWFFLSPYILDRPDLDEQYNYSFPRIYTIVHSSPFMRCHTHTNVQHYIKYVLSHSSHFWMVLMKYSCVSLIFWLNNDTFTEIMLWYAPSKEPSPSHQMQLFCLLLYG